MKGYSLVQGNVLLAALAFPPHCPYDRAQPHYSYTLILTLHSHFHYVEYSERRTMQMVS